jgi:hypothetical protein
MDRLLEQLYAYPWTSINEYIGVYCLQSNNAIPDKVLSIKEWYDRTFFSIQKHALHRAYTFEQGWSIFVLTM